MVPKWGLFGYLGPEVGSHLGNVGFNLKVSRLKCYSAIQGTRKAFAAMTANARDIYTDACNAEAAGNIERAKELFDKILNEYPDGPEAPKTKIRLKQLSDTGGKKVISAGAIIFLVVIILNMIRIGNGDDSVSSIVLFFLVPFFFVVLCALVSWDRPEIEKPKEKIRNSAPWILFIGIVNLLLGMLFIFDAILPPVFLVNTGPLILITFGLCFIVLGSIVYTTHWVLAPIALFLAIFVWGGDAALLLPDIVFGSVEPFFYGVLFFHIVFLAAMMAGLRGASGIIKLRKAANANYYYGQSLYDGVNTIEYNGYLINRNADNRFSVGEQLFDTIEKAKEYIDEQLRI